MTLKRAYIKRNEWNENHKWKCVVHRRIFYIAVLVPRVGKPLNALYQWTLVQAFIAQYLLLPVPLKLSPKLTVSCAIWSIVHHCSVDGCDADCYDAPLHCSVPVWAMLLLWSHLSAWRRESVLQQHTHTHSQTNTLTCTHSHIKQRQSFTGYFFFPIHTHSFSLAYTFLAATLYFRSLFRRCHRIRSPPVFGARINSTRKDDNITKYDADCVTGEPNTHTQPCVPLAAGCGSIFAA